MGPPASVPDHHERGARPSRTTSTRSGRGPSTCNATASPGRTLGGQHHAVVFSRRAVTYGGKPGQQDSLPRSVRSVVPVWTTSLSAVAAEAALLWLTAVTRRVRASSNAVI